MKFFTLTSLFMMLCFFCKAQTSYSNKPGFTFGGDVGLPMGNTAHKYNVALGGFIQQSVPLTGALQITVGINYTKLKGKSNVGDSVPPQFIYSYPDIDIIAANAGLKYYLQPSIYIKAEGGAAILESTVAFVYSPQIGLDIPVGKKHLLDLSLRYQGSNNYRGPNLNKISFAGLHLGFSF